MDTVKDIWEFFRGISKHWDFLSISGILSGILAFLSIVIPKLKKHKVWLRWGALTLLVVSIFWAIFLTWQYEHKIVKGLTPSKIKTELRLQFFGSTKIPTEIYSDNIYSWYALQCPTVTLLFDNKKTKNEIFCWNIFITFNRPIEFREITVSFSNPGFPPCEVKCRDQRFIIIVVLGNIPAGEMEIYAKL